MYGPYGEPYNRVDRHAFRDGKDFDAILTAHGYEPLSSRAPRRLPPPYGEISPWPGPRSAPPPASRFTPAVTVKK
jgi:hypothetical protein